MTSGNGGNHKVSNLLLALEHLCWDSVSMWRTSSVAQVLAAETWSPKGGAPPPPENGPPVKWRAWGAEGTNSGRPMSKTRTVHQSITVLTHRKTRHRVSIRLKYIFYAAPGHKNKLYKQGSNITFFKWVNPNPHNFTSMKLHHFRLRDQSQMMACLLWQKTTFYYLIWEEKRLLLPSTLLFTWLGRSAVNTVIK